MAEVRCAGELFERLIERRTDIGAEFAQIEFSVAKTRECVVDRTTDADERVAQRAVEVEQDEVVPRAAHEPQPVGVMATSH